jgi:hypothetical protein
MCSFVDRFPAYKTVILRCIDSCENNLQLLCAFDMIDRFQEHFRHNVSQSDMNAAVAELHDAYNAKNSVTNLFQ